MGVYYRKGSKIAWISYYVGPKQHRESTGQADRDEAERILAIRQGEVAGGNFAVLEARKIRVSNLLEDVYNDYLTNGYRTIDDAKHRIDKHLGPYFGHIKAIELRTPNVKAFQAMRLRLGASNAEINRECSLLKRGYALAIESGTLQSAPHIPMLKENNVRRGFVEEEQLQTLLKNLPDHLAPLIEVAYLTGWRVQAELLPMTWAQVNLLEGWLSLHDSKNNHARMFPIDSRLRAILEKQQEVTRELSRKMGRIIMFVFHRDGTRLVSFRKSWASACKAAGIGGTIPHDLRRSAIRRMVRMGVSERVAMELAGHRTRSVFDRYDIVSHQDLETAREKFEQSHSKHSPASNAIDFSKASDLK